MKLNNNQSQRKKDVQSTYAGNHLETQSIAGEENKHRIMPVNVGTHADNLNYVEGKE